MYLISLIVKDEVCFRIYRFEMNFWIQRFACYVKSSAGLERKETVQYFQRDFRIRKV